MQIKSPEHFPSARILRNPAAPQTGLGRFARHMALALLAGALAMAGTLPSRAETVPAAQLELAHWTDRDRHHSGPRRDEVRRLPQVCAVEIESRRDERGRPFRDRRDHGRRSRTVVYTEACLRTYGVKLRQLPYRCSSVMRIGGRNDRVFPENCLLDAGFDLPRRRG